MKPPQNCINLFTVRTRKCTQILSKLLAMIAIFAVSQKRPSTILNPARFLVVMNLLANSECFSQSCILERLINALFHIFIFIEEIFNCTLHNLLVFLVKRIERNIYSRFFFFKRREIRQWIIHFWIDWCKMPGCIFEIKVFVQDNIFSLAFLLFRKINGNSFGWCLLIIIYQ